MPTQSAIGAPYQPIRTQTHEMCVQLLPAKPQYSTGWYASQWPALHMHKPPLWCMGQTGHEGPCGGCVGLASMLKLQGR